LIRLAIEQRRILIEGAPDHWRIFPDPEFLTSSSGPIIFVVHGYDNEQDEAEASYQLLYENLRRVLEGNWERLRNIWELYWPGYLPKGSLLPWRKGPGELLSAASYPLQERKTSSLGERLSEYIKKIPGNPEVIFIAHSLGCRVVMEAVERLGESVPVLGICLMAAAIPTFMLEERGDLRDGVDRAQRFYVLYSPADLVLWLFFRPGQFAAHPNTFPEAVGRFGNPFRTAFQREFHNVVETGLGHGDYYRGRRKRDPEWRNKTGPTIARLFGRAPRNLPNDHYLVDWPEPARVAPIMENHLVENRIKGERR